MMFGGGKFVPLEVQSTIPVSIYAVGDTLVMGDPPYTVLLSLVDDSEPHWRWGDNASLSTISSEDLALLIDCDIAVLPRIVGHGTSRSQEGTGIAYTYRLITWSLSDDGARLFGALDWSGGGITQKRVVSLWPE